MAHENHRNEAQRVIRAYGGISAMLGDLVTMPVDVSKTRMQLAPAKTYHHAVDAAAQLQPVLVRVVGVGGGPVTQNTSAPPPVQSWRDWNRRRCEPRAAGTARAGSTAAPSKVRRTGTRRAITRRVALLLADRPAAEGGSGEPI